MKSQTKGLDFDKLRKEYISIELGMIMLHNPQDCTIRVRFTYDGAFLMAHIINPGIYRSVADLGFGIDINKIGLKIENAKTKEIILIPSYYEFKERNIRESRRI